MLDGDDDHVVLEVKTKDVTQKLDVKRDKPESVVVGGVTYQLSYPSVRVNKSDNVTTTDKAMIVVSRKK
jgi:hypothetical protein